MNDSERTLLINSLIRQLERLVTVPHGVDAGRRALKRTIEPRTTVRAAAPGTGGGSGRGPADPTSSAVADPTEVQATLASWDADLRLAWEAVGRVTDGVGRALHRDAATRVEPPTQLERRTCRSCRRVRSAADPSKPYEVDIDTDGRYADLCRYCGRIKGETGRIPPRGVVEARRDGRAITSKVWTDALAAEGRAS